MRPAMPSPSVIAICGSRTSPAEKFMNELINAIRTTKRKRFARNAARSMC